VRKLKEEEEEEEEETFYEDENKVSCNKNVDIKFSAHDAFLK
jgi:hypothetical protein